MIDLSEEHLMIRDMVREFAQKEVAPGALERDKTCEFPHDLVKKMGELGMFGLDFPEELGGSGGDALSLCIAVEEISAVDASLGLTLAAGHTLGISELEAL